MRHRRDISTAAALVLLIFIALPALASPEEFPIRNPEQPAPANARDIADYRRAVDAIVWVMVDRFDLPVPRGTVEVHPSRESFEQGLIKHLKIAPALARKTAEFAKAAVGSYTVLINAPAVADLSWPERIELLAHELTHSIQLTLANRPGIARPQWLIEGFAEWLAFNVTDALGLDDLGNARVRMTDKLRDLRRKRGLPELLKVDTFADWIETRRKYGFDATFPLAFVITDFLIKRHSLSAVKDYFRQFQHSQNHSANFRVVFGEELGDFERAVQVHLDQLLEQISH